MTTPHATKTETPPKQAEEFEVLLISDDLDPGYGVIVPTLPGCLSQGDDRDHALEMIAEAIEGFLMFPRRPDAPVDRKERLIAEYTADGCTVEVATVRVAV